MYDIKLNKTVVQNHIRYDWWKYVLLVIFTILIWNGVTSYKINKAIPQDERMEVFLVGDYIYEDNTEEISIKIMESMEGLQKLDFIGIPMNPFEYQQRQMQGLTQEEPREEDQFMLDPQTDMAGQQKLMVMIGSQSGDIFIFEEDMYKLYAEQGAFMDIADYIKNMDPSLIDIEDLEDLKVASEEDETAKQYGLPADSIKAFEGTGYNVEGKVISIMAYSKKPDKAWAVMKWLLEGNK
ncbi:MAG: hypothetical protein GX974_01930 [Clostridiales bacterium]|nr:hypothetical protein [Clostridiales bacterium]